MYNNDCRQHNIANAVSVSKIRERRFVQIRVKNRMYKIHLSTRIWSEVLLEKLTFSHLVNVIHTFYGFTSVQNCTLSSDTWVRPTSSCSVCQTTIAISTSHTSLRLPNELFHWSSYPKIFYALVVNAMRISLTYAQQRYGVNRQKTLYFIVTLDRKRTNYWFLDVKFKFSATSTMILVNKVTCIIP
jgi:hypothetical protein